MAATWAGTVAAIFWFIAWVRSSRREAELQAHLLEAAKMIREAAAFVEEKLERNAELEMEVRALQQTTRVQQRILEEAA